MYNVGHGFQVTINPEQLDLKTAKGDSLTLSLSAWGYEDALQPTAKGNIKISGNRVDIDHGHGLNEWYLNGAFGVEQGFTLSHAPDGAQTGSGNLRVDLSLGGNLRPEMDEEGLVFKDSKGRVQLSYGQLTAFDADGNILDAKMAITEGMLRLSVDDSNARYPLVIDPLLEGDVQVAPDHTDRQRGADFGFSVAIDGTTAVVGAYQHPELNGATGEYGAAFVFEIDSNNNWNQVAKLTSPAQETERFGWAVSIKNDVIVAGAPKYDNGATSRAGRAFVFVREGGVWGQTPVAELTPNDPAPGAQFGYAVDVANPQGGNDYTVVVGAWGDDKDNYDPSDDGAQSDPNEFCSGIRCRNVGSVYLFHFSDVTTGTYTNNARTSLNATAKLTDLDGDGVYDTSADSDDKDGDTLGNSVAISADGTTVVAGAFGDEDLSTSSNGNDAGAVYVWQKPSGSNGWADWDHLGESVSAMDETRKMGFTGIIYSDRLGNSVDVNSDGSIIVAGSRGYDTGTQNSVGAIFMYLESNSDWSGSGIRNEDLMLRDLAGVSDDRIGTSVSISPNGNMVVAGLSDTNRLHPGRPEKSIKWSRPAAGWASASSPYDNDQVIIASDQPASCTDVDNADCDYFGASMSNGVWTDGVRVIIGAAGHGDISSTLEQSGDDNPGKEFGLAYVFTSASGLSFTKTDNEPLPLPVTPGDTFTYTLQVINNSSDFDATNVTIVDNLPNEVTYQSDDAGCSHNNGTVTCNINGTLARDGAGSANVSITVSTASNLQYSISNTATVTAEMGGNIDDAQASEDTLINNIPTVTAGQRIDIAENVANLTSLGQIAATDLDSNATLTFSISYGNEAGIFTLDANTGELTVADNSSIDAENTTSYTLGVTVNDGYSDSETTDITIDVADINEFTPVVSGASINLSEDTAVSTLLHTVVASDNDASATLTYSLLTDAGGTFGINATSGEISLLQPLDFESTTSYALDVKVSDGDFSDTAVISVNVLNVNETPVTADDSYAAYSGIATTTGNVLNNDADEDGDTLSISDFQNPSANGGTVASLGDGTFTYTSAADFAGQDTFTYLVSDGNGGTATATVTMNVSANPPPTVVGDAATVDEGASVNIDVLSNDSDDNGLDPTTLTVTTQPAYGSVVVQPNGSIDYTHNGSETLSDSFTYTVQDLLGAVSSPATVTVTVTPQNDTPAATPQAVTTAEDTAVAITLSGSDAEDDPLTYTVIGQPTHGTLSGTAPNLTYTPDLNFNGTDAFTFKVNDGSADSTEASVSITVEPVQDAPVADAQAVTTAEDTAVAITLSGSDAEDDPLTYTVIGQPTHGALIGTAPNLTYTPDPDFNGQDSFTFKVNDGSDDSTEARVSITIEPVQDAPVADAQAVTTAEDSAVAITLSGSDADNDSLTYTVIGQPTHGALIGTAPNLTYTPDLNFNGQDSFTFKVNDGSADSTEARVSITVEPVQDAPVANAQAVTTAEDSAVAITLSGSDADNDPISYTLLSTPSHGTLIGTAPNLTYTPDLNFNGQDSFTFKVNDGSDNSTEARVSITVEPVQDAPVADAQAVTTAEDSAVAITLSGSDADNDPISYTLLSAPSHGTLSGTAPNLIYTPDLNFNGTDAFTFKVNDGSADSTEASVSITVEPVQDAPVADAQAVTTAEDSAVAITLSGSDADNDPISYTLLSAPSHGALSGTAPNLTYTPDLNFNGQDSFTFKVNDGNDDSVAATVSISITASADVPVADVQSVSTDEDTAVNIILSGSDVDGDSLTFVVIAEPANGTLSGTAPNLTYTPHPDFNGTDAFTFKVNDGGADSDAATVAITINAISDTPTISAIGAITTDEDSATGAIAFVINDAETTPGNLVVTASSSNQTLLPDANITLGGSGADRSVSITPAAQQSGSAVVTVTVADSDGESVSESFNLTVNTINDDPTISAIADLSMDEDQAPISIAFTIGDVETATADLYVTAASSNPQLFPAANLQLSGSGASRKITLTPAANASGAAAVTIAVTDGDNGRTIESFNVNIAPINDAPVANGQSLAALEDTPLGITLTGSDLDSDALTYLIVTQPAHGQLNGTPPSLTYTPATDFHGVDSFTFKASDGRADSATVSINITIVEHNDAPVATGQTITVDEDSPVAIELEGTDAEGNALTFTLLSTPQQGTLTGEAPSLSYTPRANFAGADSFTFKVNDGITDSAAASVTINVTAIQDIPIAEAQSLTTVEDAAIDIALNGTDADGDSLSYALVTQPAHGSLSGTAPNLTFTPNADFSGEDQLTFTVNDGSDHSEPATVRITVTENNQAPVLARQGNNGLVTVTGQSATLNFGVTDADSTDSHIFTVSASALGTTTIEGSDLIYNALNAGSETLILTVIDSRGASDTIELPVTVNEATVNDNNSDGLSDEQASSAGLDPDSIDTDTDGAPDVREIGDPDHPTDSDEDGVIDALETGDGAVDNSILEFIVPPTTAHDLGLDDLAGKKVTISTENGQLIAHTSGQSGLPISNETDLEVPDDGYHFPLGLFDFSITAPSGSATVVFQFPSTVSIPQDTIVRKLDSSDTWQTFTAAVIDHTERTITMTLTDNDAFDRDGRSGIIRDPWGLAVTTATIPDNTAPTATSRSLSVTTGSTLAITLTGSDADGDSLTYTLVTQPANGTLSGSAPDLSYRPNDGFTGTDSFSFRVSDGKTDSADAIVTIQVYEASSGGGGALSPWLLLLLLLASRRRFGYMRQ
ncbi:Ig-like domain-containing protein [Candidatus Endoriftia persephone]|uniref:Ig-like domain-containing protein n=2 Tax=Gammaproteobacteria TaxID=1236 RepID=A0A9J6ZYG9_9GAMM|nr:Ig-like domain-containing protein [Candidatus Endoriftia persephone]USF87813.1 Ig-like domain-containing protein [Candidatus Endoriftia persephone]